MRSLKSFSEPLRATGLGAAAGLLFSLSFLSVTAQQSPSTVADEHVIRVWGYSGISSQMLQWENGYKTHHPDVRFHNEFHGAAAVMAGLYDGVGDLALMGREIWPVETMAYQWVYQQQPFG